MFAWPYDDEGLEWILMSTMSMLPGLKELCVLEHSLSEPLGPQGVLALLFPREIRRMSVLFEAVEIFRRFFGLSLSGLLRPPIARRRKFLDFERRL